MPAMKQYPDVVDSKLLASVVKTYRADLKRLADIEDNLNARFLHMADPIRAIVLSAATGEPLLFIGKPGTAKSRLIRAFCECVGVPVLSQPTIEHEEYFEYLLTRFTEPGEIFGFYDLQKAYDEHVMERDQRGMMQQARVIYIDEVFNASSAILNALLAFMNEKYFHERGRRQVVPWQALFSATNQVPQTDDLRAVFDRFLLRCEIDNIGTGPKGPQPEDVMDLLQKGWRETYGALNGPVYPGILDRLELFRGRLTGVVGAQNLLNPTGSMEFYNELTRMVSHIRGKRLSDMSNRRLVKFMYVMLVHAIYMTVRDERPSDSVQLTDRELSLWRFIVDRRNEASEALLPQVQ